MFENKLAKILINKISLSYYLQYLLIVDSVEFLKLK